MLIKVKAEDMSQILNKIKHIAKTDKACPAASFGLFETLENEVVITVSGLTNYAVVRLKAEIFEPGECLIEISKLAMIFGTLSGEVTLEDKAEVVWIKKDKTKCKLEILPVSDFRFNRFKINQPDISFRISSKNLFDGLKKTEKFSSASGPVLSGINIKISKRTAVFCATDGNRLARVVESCECEDSNVEFILPSASVSNLLPLIPNDQDAEVSVNSSIFAVNFGDIEFSTCLIDGNFPKIDGLIPKSSNIEFVIDKASLKRSIERISIVETIKDNYTALFTVKGLTITVEANEYKYNDVLILSEKSGDDIAFKLNRIFLENVLNVINGDEVRFKLTTPRSPILIPNMENTYLIMPIG